MSYYTLAVNCVHHDSSVSLFEDDRLIYFIQSERFTRNKHDFKIDLRCFDHIAENITQQIDLLVITPSISIGILNEMISNLKAKFTFKQILDPNLLASRNTITHDDNEMQKYLSHHCSHALSAFYMSPFDDAVCLVIDASGSSYFLADETRSKPNTSEAGGIFGVETCSILEITKNYKKKYLYKRSQSAPHIITKNSRIFLFGTGMNERNPNRFKKFSYDFDATSHADIGSMYKTISGHLGFGSMGAGKVMGLSAYGTPNSNIPSMLIRDTILSDNNLFLQSQQLNSSVYPELFDNLSFQTSADLAYAVQKALEKIFLVRAEYILKNSKMRNLIITGGCALNILGVSLIKEKYPEFNIFVDPIANDATHAIGLGIHYYNLVHMNGRLEKKSNFSSIYLGPEYGLEETSRKIDDFLSA